MRVFPLFELFLAVFTMYALFKFDGGMRVIVPTLCLVTIFLFERLRKKPTEVREHNKRVRKPNHIQYKQFNIEEEKSLSQPESWNG